jgi:hypothetical protein
MCGAENALSEHSSCEILKNNFLVLSVFFKAATNSNKETERPHFLYDLIFTSLEVIFA